MEKIQVFVTGGTFDKDYNYINGKLFFKNTHLDDMLDRGRCTLNIDLKTLMMLDSLEMTDKDRAFLVSECKATSASKIVMTHGTDTIVKTATYFANAKMDKTIVLTGAMIPYAFGSSSDGFFNLGSALAFAQTLPSGVYVCMNGKYFDYNKVKKNYETGYFEAVS